MYVTISFKDGKIYVNIEESNLKVQEEYCKSALIGYVVRNISYIKTMENFVSIAWNFVSEPLILHHEDRYFIFLFCNSREL